MTVLARPPQATSCTMHASMQSVVVLTALLVFRHVVEGADAVPSFFVYRDATKLSVPPSFVGISIEPIQHAPYFANEPTFVNMVSLLSSFDTGPFSIRWGGNAQDFVDYELPTEVWETLAELHEATNCRYILGLNLKINDPDLAVNQVRNFLRTVPWEALEALAVGNEPDLYHTKDSDEWVKQYAQKEYWDHMEEYYYKIGRVLKYAYPNATFFAAPEVANFASWSVGDIREWASREETKPYAKMVTAHYYTGRARDSASDTDFILQQDEMDFIARNSKRWTDAAHDAGLMFKLDETNSLSGQGKLGVSNTMASAIFTIDYIFTLMETKADGINFHMGACKPYSAIQLPAVCMRTGEVGYNCDEDGKEIGFSFHKDDCPGNTVNATVAEARPQFYALWLVQWLLQGLPKMVETADSGVTWKAKRPFVKMYAFRAVNGYETRILMVQKTCKHTVDLEIKLPGGWGTATYFVLNASSGDATALVDEISFAGQTIDEFGEVSGELKTKAIPSKWDGAYSVYPVTVPQCSATVLIVRG